MSPDAPWTLDELTTRVVEATHRLGLLQSNGQVADAPNARAIRWYQSTGLVSRPQQRGRVAFYGPQHLFQLVAIKRLQAQGMALDEIQQALLGKDDDAIRGLAALPRDLEEVVFAVVDAPAPAPPSRSFWAADVVDADVAPAAIVGPAAPGRLAFDHPCGVTLVLPSGDNGRTPTAEDAQAILSVVVEQLTARGLLAVSPTSPHEKEKP